MFAVPLNGSLLKKERVEAPLGEKVSNQRVDSQLPFAFTLVALSVMGSSYHMFTGKAIRSLNLKFIW